MPRFYRVTDDKTGRPRWYLRGPTFASGGALDPRTFTQGRHLPDPGPLHIELRRHGAIASAATAPWDIRCSFSAIDAPGYRSLSPGERVVVRYHRANQESFRYVADWVRRLEHGERDAGPSADAG